MYQMFKKCYPLGETPLRIKCVTGSYSTRYTFETITLKGEVPFGSRSISRSFVLRLSLETDVCNS